MKRSLALLVGLLAFGALSFTAGAAPPGCVSGEGYVAFAPYTGPGGTFTFTITFENGEQCVVEFQVPAGTTSAEDIAALFAGALESQCGDLITPIDYPGDPNYGDNVCIRRNPLLGDDVRVSRVRGDNPPGTISGFATGISASPAVARFDFAGLPTSGVVQLNLFATPVVTMTDGKSLAQLELDVMTAIQNMGFIVIMEPTGELRVPFQDSNIGIAVLCTDPGVMTWASLAVDMDNDGLEDLLDCPADFTGPKPDIPDGNVDALDYLGLIAQWGSPCAPPCTADIVPDGNVDALDFLDLLAQWGNPSVCVH